MEKGEPERKKFRMLDVLLSVICVVFIAEAVAPAAAIGNSQFFWWIFLSITFLLPYGLVAAELGTTYVSDGGIYYWVKKAFGHKWGTRVAWYYWINYPIWMTSLAIIFPTTIESILHIELGTIPTLIIELAFVWIGIFTSFFPIADSVWILNGAAVIKVVIAITVGVMGVYIALTQGMANPMDISSFLPVFEPQSLSHLSVILFNFLGFEIVCTYAGDMSNPEKQIPKAIILGGLVIAAIYIFSAFGISVAIPSSEISSGTGLIDAFALMSGQESGPVITIFAILFLLTLFGNNISWALGVNNTACFAAEQNDLPDVFGIRSKKNHMPMGSALMNGLIATIILLITPLIPNQDLFWNFFGLNMVMILLSYILVFPAFYKLRKIDPDAERPFKVKAGPVMLKLLVALPMLMLVIAVIFTAVPMDLSSETLMNTLPITIGAVICILIGEIMIHFMEKKYTVRKMSI